MNGQHAPIEVTESRERHGSARLHGRWLLLARLGWVALVVLTLGIFGASLPVYIAQLQTPCTGSACQYQQLTPGQVGTLTGMGLSLSDYAALLVALTLALEVGCLVVSTVIIWRRSHDRMALLVALMLVTAGVTGVTATAPATSPWLVPDECLTFLSTTLLVLVFLLFPSGQFVPHWTRWTLVVFLAWLVPTAFVAPFMPNTPVDLLGFLVVLTEMAILAVIQLYRYRRVSSPCNGSRPNGWSSVSLCRALSL